MNQFYSKKLNRYLILEDFEELKPQMVYINYKIDEHDKRIKGLNEELKDVKLRNRKLNEELNDLNTRYFIYVFMWFVVILYNTIYYYDKIEFK